jgi:hypothetical protein
MAPAAPRKRSTQGSIGPEGYPASPPRSWGWLMDVIFAHGAGVDVPQKRVTACRVVPDPAGQHAEGIVAVQDVGTMPRALPALADGLAAGGARRWPWSAPARTGGRCILSGRVP